MLESMKLCQEWFAKWEEGDYTSLPVSTDFQHESPFGTIQGKEEYLKLVEANLDKFLGYQFIILDEVFEKNKACVRYRAIQDEFELEVSEWHYSESGFISKIIAYYHIGEIKEDRQLTNP